MSVLMERARTVVREVFGHDELRAGQDDIVRAVLNGNDVLGVLPTGGGKSLCYQVPALLFPHMTIVVSPLIALMKDQTERLRARGIAAYAVHGGMTSGDVNAVMSEAGRGGVRLLYVAPERLASATFRRLVRPMPISLLTVDEAHCISEWGHDFRPSYQSIATFFDDRAPVPILTLTATATPDVRADIVKALHMEGAIEIVRGFDRPNLSFRVVETASKIEAITQTARMHPNEPMLIYSGSRRRVDTITEDLRRRGIGAEAYHAGMPSHQRSDVQDRFLRGTTNVLVATNAFGMGIDKADVRHVIHTDLTLTLEAYYQEAGRAGRDGLPSTCTLLYQSQDRSLMEFYIAGTYPEPAQVAAVYTYLCDRAGLAPGTSTDEPILADAASIAIATHLSAAVVGGVLTLLERAGVLVRTTPNGQARIRLRTSPQRLEAYAAQAPAERALVATTIARLMAGRAIGDDVDVSLPELLRRTAITPREFADTMRAMHLAQLVRYIPPSGGGGIVLTSERTTPERVPIDWPHVHARRDHAISKLDVMVRYAETRQCKRNFILSYFGDASANGPCGRCSSCLGVAKRAPVTDRQMEIIRDLVRTAVQLRGRFGRHVLVDVLTGTPSERITSNRLDRCVTWGRYRERSRSELLEALDVAVDRAWLIRTPDLYPTIGVTQDGRDLVDDLPSPLQREHSAAPTSASAAIVDALVATRDRIAQRDGVLASSLVSRDELQRIADDAPTSVDALVPGRHGSGLFLARHGEEIVRSVADALTVASRAVPKIRADEDATLLAGLIRRGRTLRELAIEARMTPPNAAHAIQRAIEAGLHVERHDLIDERLYEEVLTYLRHHRFAKLRHVREHLGGDIDLADLRVAIAFARRDLFDGTP